MNINLIGLLAGITTIFTIGFGHVMVRKWESRLVSITPAVFACVLLGIGFGIGSFYSDSNVLSSVLGIVSITFLWDALEFHRQQQRVIKGHVPANPENPRHQKFLTQYPSATIMNLTDREPRGYPYSDEEIDIILNQSAWKEKDNQ